jgi:hypothetical protein
MDKTFMKQVAAATVAGLLVWYFTNKREQSESAGA